MFRNLSQKDFIIIANGPFLSKEIILEAIDNKIILALDGAANKLLALDIKPHIILGDFDSIAPQPFSIQQTFYDLSDETKAYESTNGYYIVPDKNQKLTDLTKAILFCDKQSAASITMICATGGRMDHHEGAVRSLRSHHKKDRPLILHTDIQSLRFAKDEAVTIIGEKGDNVGILAYPHAVITTQGLEFEANNYELIFGFSENICNSLVNREAQINVKEEALIVMPPLLAAQRR